MVKTLAKTNIFEIWEGNDSIIHIVFSKLFNVDEENAKDYAEVCLKLETKKRLIMVDLREVENMSIIALKKMFDPRLVDITKASAIVVAMNKPFVSIGISFLLKLGGSPYPLEIFTDEIKAVEWLMQNKD